MSTQVVQTLTDGSAHYTQSTPLDGVLFVLHFDYNSRDGSWYLSVNDLNDDPISGCQGRRLVADYPVLPRSVSPDRPAGVLLVTSQDGVDPGLLDLGDGSVLSYVPEADVAALL